MEWSKDWRRMLNEGGGSFEDFISEIPDDLLGEFIAYETLDHIEKAQKIGEDYNDRELSMRMIGVIKRLYELRIARGDASFFQRIAFDLWTKVEYISDQRIKTNPP